MTIYFYGEDIVWFDVFIQWDQSAQPVIDGKRLAQNFPTGGGGGGPLGVARPYKGGRWGKF